MLYTKFLDTAVLIWLHFGILLFFFKAIYFYSLHHVAKWHSFIIRNRLIMLAFRGVVISRQFWKPLVRMVVPESHLSDFFQCDFKLLFPKKTHKKPAEYAVAVFKYSQMKHLTVVSTDRKSMKPEVPGPYFACFLIIFLIRYCSLTGPLASRDVYLLLCRKSLSRKAVIPRDSVENLTMLSVMSSSSRKRF